MRMWGVEPIMLCKRHLLGEHVEMHMFIGTMKKGKSLKGYIDKGLIDISKIWERHDELVKEMKRRGIKHSSPLPCGGGMFHGGEVDVDVNLIELYNRCKHCRKRIDYVRRGLSTAQLF